MTDLIIIFVCCLVTIQARKNVLFLVSDDMRPQLGAYEGGDFPSPVHPRAYSPNLDALAKRSLLLKKAYVQQALCNPSRSSLLTGRRPDTTHVYDLTHYFRKVGGNFTTLPQYFKNNGYMTVGMGKIFHPGKEASDYDDPISWSVPYYQAKLKGGHYFSKNHSWVAVPKAEYEKYPLPDDILADHAIKVLREVAPAAKSGEQPFFVGLGFLKPHLPFVFREEFLNLYPMENISLPDNPYAPVKMPEVAWFDFSNLRTFGDIQRLNASGAINTTFPDDVVKQLRRAYYSAISYVDSLVGQVIQELDNLGLANNTIISFWGDHGWELGEHGEWCKQTNFENAVHAPMMIHIPGETDDGIVTEQLTEFVDLFPTLVEAAGLTPLPPCPENSTGILTCREGQSLMPLVSNPDFELKKAAFSQFPRSQNGTDIMGYTLRTEQYRYTEWPAFNGPPTYTPDWTNLYGAELYNHTQDPEENYNRAYDSGYSPIRAVFSSILRKGWRFSQKP
ncbi:hypothetical protein SNE40_013410 [Patella caerulea]|uniref:Sulfatase N-terminal domain-containing protein n=1 Tax=Patella caerulea TaxID=87958 RepID=A0AAN8PQQ1_PATCE